METLLFRGNNATVRALQPYSITVYKKEFNALHAEAAVAPLSSVQKAMKNARPYERVAQRRANAEGLVLFRW